MGRPGVGAGAGDRVAGVLPLVTEEATPPCERTGWNVRRSGSLGRKWPWHFGIDTAGASRAAWVRERGFGVRQKEVGC